ncbi:hypothetical protein AVEN_17098-1 [Araneus ventricosus]|uniref:Uncharacterized protein n=1 Tax=Araneus ventricosus TaxID=182803 RepID=A0A4Y2TXK9_ARAVE|nr:hypothetical protein AVEN_17098-1 [Araneus ventricosus]
MASRLDIHNLHSTQIQPPHAKIGHQCEKPMRIMVFPKVWRIAIYNSCAIKSQMPTYPKFGYPTNLDIQPLHLNCQAINAEMRPVYE